MSHRCLAAVFTVIGVVALTPMFAACQSAEPPRTPDGRPDLQGVWSYATLTPLERRAELADREFFTAEETAARNAAVTVDLPPRPGSVGSYNALWFDKGRVSPDLRTSQIVDPPDGRLPLTPEALERIAAKQQYRRAHPADSWLDLRAWHRCITYHGVPPVGSPISSGSRFPMISWYKAAGVCHGEIPKAAAH